MTRWRTWVIGILLAALTAMYGPSPRPLSAMPAPAMFQSLTPARLLDTRADGVTIDAAQQRGGSLGPGQSITLHVTGRGGLPDSGVGVVALNVTAVDATSTSFITVYPSGTQRPNTSNLNPMPWITSTNLVLAQVGVGGNVELYNSTGRVQLIADVFGWFPTTSTFVPLTPSRIMDTRAKGVTVDGLASGTGPLRAATTVPLQITGRADVPATGVGAVAVNVTAVDQTTPTFITVAPTGASLPVASNLNPSPGVVAPNMAIVRVGEGGMIDVYNSTGSVNIVVDIVGWFPQDPSYTPLAPARILDTRATGTTVDGLGAAGGALGVGGVRNVKVTGRAGVPTTGVAAVALNVTAVDHTKNTFLTVFSSGSSRPTTSNLNPFPSLITPNLVLAKVGSDGKVSIFNSVGTVDVIVDVAGWFPSNAGGNSVLNVAAGAGHSCAITAANTVSCWGSNALGQIGQPLATTSWPAPAAVAGVSAVAVTTGGSHTCALTEAATVKCWGAADLIGASGEQSDAGVVDVVGLTPIRSLDAGQSHTCAVSTAGEVYCWGSNSTGALGQSSAVTNSGGPLKVPGVTNATRVSAGDGATCVVIGDGTVKCWGANTAGPLGTVRTLTGVAGATSVSVGGSHACIVLATGDVKCFGANGSGQLGSTPPNGTGTPTTVPGVTGVTDVQAGSNHTCALRLDGTVVCWGANDVGQLGTGSTATWSLPATVPGVSGVAQLSVGAQHTCAVTSSGQLWCWGSDSNGQIGTDIGQTTLTRSPVQIAV